MQKKQLGQKLLLDSQEVQGFLTKQILHDAALSLINPNNSKTAQSEIYYDMPRILTEMGISLQNSARMGRMVAKMYRQHFKEEPKTIQRDLKKII